jgi:hypothetical protein
MESKKTATETKPITEIVNGNLLQYNPITGGWDTIFTAPKDIKDLSLSDQVNLEEKGYTVDENGNLIKAEVSASPEEIKTANKIITAINNIKQIKDWESYVGPIQGKFPALSKEHSDFKNEIIHLKNLLTVGNLGLMKGVLSETDVQILTGAASALSLTMSEERFKKELDAIQKIMSDKLNKVNTTSQTQSLDEYYQNNPAQQKQIEQLLKDNPDLGDEDILQLLNEGGGTFSQSGGGTLKATGSVSYRHNNPLNIKYGNFASKYGATEGQKATDGGKFAYFPDEATGLRAAKYLLRGNSYKNLTLEAAMRRWSGNGYGADVAPELKNKKISRNSYAVALGISMVL